MLDSPLKLLSSTGPDANVYVDQINDLTRGAVVVMGN